MMRIYSIALVVVLLSTLVYFIVQDWHFVTIYQTINFAYFENLYFSLLIKPCDYFESLILIFITQPCFSTKNLQHSGPYFLSIRLSCSLLHLCLISYLIPQVSYLQIMLFVNTFYEDYCRSYNFMSAAFYSLFDFCFSIQVLEYLGHEASLSVDFLDLLKRLQFWPFYWTEGYLNYYWC